MNSEMIAGTGMRKRGLVYLIIVFYFKSIINIIISKTSHKVFMPILEYLHFL